ncbi:hypothetical protein NEMBOFW57_009974 [Staphylotrichum longicolle]|uniref:Uncharacterized protein n=1 Tax=Staphylotrichum longicolle TaxID=669026 RepID=A0AAD4EQ95_9PEZI|nr:hypothetical protein NEMBOFW57_009974 [Staphylotrichum longicolle]
MAETSAVPSDAVMTEAPAVGENTPDQGAVLQQQQQQEEQQEQALDPTLEQPSDGQPPLPAAFPKKRRGRPPGRPNATVRDADYEENPLVQAWNAAKNDRAVPVVSISIREALTEQSLVHDTQRAIFRMPSRETILFVQGWITAKHIASQRPSYVNGLLIHSRGQDAPVSCVQCTEKRAKNALGPFMTCRVLPGSYHNSCSNCKWFDNTSSCSLYTGPKPNRKRKAKEQLPPPPASGVGPPADAAVGAGGQDSVSSGSHPYIQSQLQPEADMTIIQGQHDQRTNLTPTTDAMDNHSQHHTEISGSEPPEAPSQPDSDSHFVLSRPHQGGGVHGPEHDDGDYVDAQLAAQLLPEIQRQDP